MSRFRELIGSHHIHLALATGASIIALAYVSKRVLTEPIHELAQALPPFVAVVGEGVIGRYPKSRFARTRYWVLAILITTALIIAVYLLRR